MSDLTPNKFALIIENMVKENFETYDALYISGSQF